MLLPGLRRCETAECQLPNACRKLQLWLFLCGQVAVDWTVVICGAVQEVALCVRIWGCPWCCQQPWLDPNYARPNHNALSWELRQTPLMRFHWAGPLLYMLATSKDSSGDVSPKGGSSTGESPSLLRNWLLSSMSMEFAVVLAPLGTGVGDWVSMAASGFAFPPQVPLSWALHGMSYLLKHWIQINFFTCCFVWSCSSTDGKC